MENGSTSRRRASRRYARGTLGGRSQESGLLTGRARTGTGSNAGSCPSGGRKPRPKRIELSRRVGEPGRRGVFRGGAPTDPRRERPPRRNVEHARGALSSLRKTAEPLRRPRGPGAMVRIPRRSLLGMEAQGTEADHAPVVAEGPSRWANGGGTASGDDHGLARRSPRTTDRPEPERRRCGRTSTENSRSSSAPADSTAGRSGNAPLTTARRNRSASRRVSVSVLPSTVPSPSTQARNPFSVRNTRTWKAATARTGNAAPIRVPGGWRNGSLRCRSRRGLRARE